MCSLGSRFLDIILGGKEKTWVCTEELESSVFIKHRAKHLTALSYSTLPEVLCEIGMTVIILQRK